MLDICIFRTDQGGNPDLVRESQRRRYADVGLVDKFAKGLLARGRFEVERNRRLVKTKRRRPKVRPLALLVDAHDLGSKAREELAGERRSCEALELEHTDAGERWPGNGGA